MDKLRVAFMGSPRFAVPCLEVLLGAPSVEVVLVVTQPDKPAGRGQKLAPPPVKEVALAAGPAGIAPSLIVQPEKLRTPPFAEVVRPLGLDLIVVVAYGKILPPDLLAVPRFGCWNLHASLLPKYRGAAPIQWAVLNGDATTGVTLMQMEAGLDTGPMLRKREVSIADDDTADTESLVALNAAFALPNFAGVNAAFYQDVNQHPFRFYNNIRPTNDQTSFDISLKVEHDFEKMKLTAWASEPASGSVMVSAQRISGSTRRGRYFFFCSSVPYSLMA